MFKAREKGRWDNSIRELIVTEQQLTRKGAVHSILNKLNKAGFQLGSGHELLEIKKTGSKTYLFSALPYYGHSGQSVGFKFFKEI